MKKITTLFASLSTMAIPLAILPTVTSCKVDKIQTALDIKVNDEPIQLKSLKEDDVDIGLEFKAIEVTERHELRTKLDLADLESCEIVSENQDIARSLSLVQDGDNIKLHFDGMLWPDDGQSATLNGSFQIKASYKDLYYDASGKTITEAISKKIDLTVDYDKILEVDVEEELECGVFDDAGSSKNAIKVTTYLPTNDDDTDVTNDVNLKLKSKDKATQDLIDQKVIWINDSSKKIEWSLEGVTKPESFNFYVWAQPKILDDPEFKDYYGVKFQKCVIKALITP